jgi:uncharacterized protein YjbI with pentapeptide repeats
MIATMRRWIPAAACLAVLSITPAHAACPPSCAGVTLTTPNFSHQDLANADFKGAMLIAPNFVRANLAGAHFDGATFKARPHFPAQTPDFTFANLTGATFVGAQFLAPTYFTYATLTCADFSQTNLETGADFSQTNPATGAAVFGDEPLIYDSGSSCRTKFQKAKMNCEFIDDWHNFDLTEANVSACDTQLGGRDFSGAILEGVNLTGATLDGSSFAGANLRRALLVGASLQCTTAAAVGSARCVDLGDAQLQGANLSRANLTGASLYRAFLSNDVNGDISQAATLENAHLKNVNLAFAQMSGVDFDLANFYGDVPANNAGCETTESNNSGFTNGCASAHGATMTGTTFTGAYLFGVDFTAAAIAGVDFTDAVLTGADFADASISASADSGAATKFIGAYLQGTNLARAASLSGADLTNAFVDFRSGGNILYAYLSGADHNTFACGSPSTCDPAHGEDVCVEVRYGEPTTVPPENPTITCPAGTSGGSGCGSAATDGSNAQWKSSLAIGTPANPGPPAGWYEEQATYTPQAAADAVCNGKGKGAAKLLW